MNDQLSDKKLGNIPYLPLEIWSKILLEQSSIKEFIRFSAVQKSWKSIAKEIIPGQIPWLIVPTSCYSNTLWYTLVLFNPMDRRLYEFKFPSCNCSPSDQRSSRTWFDVECTLNPFTLKSVWLPRFRSIDKRCSPNVSLLKFDDAGSWCKKGFCAASFIAGENIGPLKLGHCDSSDVMSRLWSYMGDSFECRSSLLEILPQTFWGRKDFWDHWDKQKGTDMSDSIIYKGCIYELSCSCLFWVFDLETKVSKKFKLDYGHVYYYLRDYEKFLVEFQGDLLCVFKDRKRVGGIRLYKLDLDAIVWNMGGKQLQGILSLNYEHEVKNIGDYALLLGKRSTKVLHVSNFVGSFKSNCIYTTSSNVFSLNSRTWESFGFYSRKTGFPIYNGGK